MPTLSNQQYCSGCYISSQDLLKEYNEMHVYFNEKFNTNYQILEDEEDVLQQPEIVFMNYGGWYCSSDCLSDCY